MTGIQEAFTSTFLGVTLPTPGRYSSMRYLLLSALLALPASAQVTINVPSDVPLLGLALQQSTWQDTIRVDGGVHSFDVIGPKLARLTGTDYTIKDSYVVFRPDGADFTLENARFDNSALEVLRGGRIMARNLEMANADRRGLLLWGGSVDLDGVDGTINNVRTNINLSGAQVDAKNVDIVGGGFYVSGDVLVLENISSAYGATAMADPSSPPIQSMIDGRDVTASNLSYSGYPAGNNWTQIRSLGGDGILRLNRFTFCDNDAQLILYLSGNTVVEFTESLICRNTGTGPVFARPPTTAGTYTFSQSAFYDNTAAGGLFGHPPSVVTSSNFQGNDPGFSGTATMDAANNYWGAVDGPYHANQNPTGSGDPASSYINVIPWLTTPAAGAPMYLATSVDETPYADGFSLYPNPATGQIMVSEYVQVFDLLGRKVAEGDGVLDVSRLAAGTYFARTEASIHPFLVR